MMFPGIVRVPLLSGHQMRALPLALDAIISSDMLSDFRNRRHFGLDRAIVAHGSRVTSLLLLAVLTAAMVALQNSSTSALSPSSI